LVGEPRPFEHRARGGAGDSELQGVTAMGWLGHVRDLRREKKAPRPFGGGALVDARWRHTGGPAPVIRRTTTTRRPTTRIPRSARLDASSGAAAERADDAARSTARRAGV